jgi:predicted dienelactone hydrolase
VQFFSEICLAIVNQKTETMKKILQLTAILMMMSLFAFAQYQVGQKVITYTDPDRDNREIETYVFYPSATGGVDAAIASGEFPAIVFGHGTAMADVELYQYLWDALPAAGYICLVPTTEGGSPPFSAPYHEPFGLDLKFINLQIKAEGNNSSSFFYNHVAEKTAIMGHSLGGKATLIAAANNSEITTIITLCAALGDPPFPYSSNGYDVINNSLPYITVPSLVVDTEFDCVVPDDEGHQMTYDLIPADCKTYVKILGGGHCYMASSDASSCETTEGWLGGNCEGDFTITREDQNQTVLDIILPYFEYTLKNVSIAEDEFLAYISSSPEVTYLRDCEMPDPTIENIDIYSAVENITVAYGTPEVTAKSQLAQNIYISDSEGGNHMVALSWTVAGYNANVAATYVATGTFALPAGVTQTTPPTTLSVTATITVQPFVSKPTFETDSEFAIFPNPADEKIYFQILSPKNDELIEIFTIFGSLVKQHKITENETIDISDLSSGMYIVRFRDKLIKLSVE